MKDQLRSVDVFLSSPGDVEPERMIARKVIAYVDRVVARPLGFALNLISSDSIVPNAGRPQEVINSQIAEYDIYVGIMWSRFGTPTDRAGSGTAEEFLEALRRRNALTTGPRLLFYFCDRPIPFPRGEEDLRQLEAVIRFRNVAMESALVRFYTDTGGFESVLQEHLIRHLLDAVRPRVLSTIASDITTAPPTEHLEGLMKSYRWIGYSPVDFDPDNGHYPDDASLRQDLTVLSGGPFGALLTFGSEAVLSQIPSLARHAGIRGIIMGIYDPLKPVDVQAAIRASSEVDGFCVGHLGLRRGQYSLSELSEVIKHVRQATGKPVATCETMEEFVLLPGLVQLVDWIFPDVHAFWHEGAAPDAAIEDVLDHLESARKLRDHAGGTKFVLLNMISYPSMGGAGLTEPAQATFFRRLLQRLRFDTRVPSRTYPCFFAAFDNVWKRPERGWSQAELSTGLYRIDRTPKTAVAAFVESRRMA